MSNAFASLALAITTLATATTAQAPVEQDQQIRLRYASFDPLKNAPVVPAALRSAEDTRLWIVQFNGRPTDESRAAVRAQGGEIHSYLPDNAYVVRMPIGNAAGVQAQPSVRSVTWYHPAFRLEEFLIAEIQDGSVPQRRYNIVVVDKHNDKPSLGQKIQAIGGQIDSENPGSLLFEVTLNGNQLIQAARMDEVLWIDRWGAPEDDMDNARIQGGGDYVETQGGYTGAGITGHQMEGLNPSHVDWNLRPIGWPAGCTSSSGHGHNTAGIVYGNGTSHPSTRGMAPDAQAVFSSCRTNRYQNFQSLISNHEIMFTTASWGSPRTRQYTSVSAEADDICFDQDIAWTNSQSNAGNQDSRAEAWAKNVFACGGVSHRDNANPADDSWRNGGASIGPAADGRTKPDLCAYYDNIATSSTSGWTGTFGGTSGATPIVAGHNALAIQMFTDSIFNNRLRNPGGSRFSNKPRFTTLKALQLANATQYPFTQSSTDNRREHQGYGFPSLRTMWDNRGKMFLVDEEDVLTQGSSRSYKINVGGGEPQLAVVMSFADVAGNPSASQAAVNDLSLKVTAPNGTVYWGNNGLTSGNFSVAGGTADTINTAECVFVQSPAAGSWDVEVIATLVAVDTHVETPAVDADFGLCVRGGRGSTTGGTSEPFGRGCAGSRMSAGGVIVDENSSGTHQGVLLVPGQTWAVEVTAAATDAFSTFEMKTLSLTGPTTWNVAVWRDNNGLPGNRVTTGTIAADATGNWQTAQLNAPVRVTQGEKFFVSVQVLGFGGWARLASGGTQLKYVGGANGGWGTPLTAAVAVRINGIGTNLIPQFAISGFPDIGDTFRARLSDSIGGASAVLLTGVSDSMWGSTQLPFSLTNLGAPGCDLLVSPDTALNGQTNGAGDLSIAVPLPNDPSLVGAKAFQQFVVLDPINTLGVVVSNGVRLAIGQ